MSADDILFRRSPDPSWIYDRETLAFLKVNPAAVAAYGYSEAEFLGMTIADIRPTEDVGRLRAMVGTNAAFLDAGQWIHIWKSGERRTVQVRSTPLAFEGRSAELAAVRDITEEVRASDRAAKALDAEREAAHLLAMAGQVARFGAWSLNTQTGDVVWSGATAAIHEEPPEIELEVTRGLSYYIEEHRPLIAEAVRLCSDEKTPFDLTLQIVTANGRPCWVRVVGEPVCDAGGRVTAVRGAFQDVDDLIRTRERLRAGERRVAAILDGVNEGFLVLTRDWTVVFANPAVGRMLSRRIEDLVGKSLWDSFPEALATDFPAEYQRALDTGETVLVEDYFEPLAAWFEVCAYPSDDGLTLNIRDVTARRAALNELLTSEERFRLIAEVTNDIIWDWDLESNHLWFSDNFDRVFGFDAERQWSAASWAAHIHLEDRARVLGRLDAHLSDGLREYRDEYRLECADGSFAQVIDRGVIIRDASGQARRMMGSLMDITERVEIQQQLLESQKLEAMGRMTGGVAHDFNNLLTVIIGASESLEDAADGLPEAGELTSVIAAAAARGADLTSHMLAFARRQPLEPRVSDIGAILEGLSGMLRRTLGEDVSLAVISHPAVWKGMVDPAQLETAVLNLAINARDAMPNGGALTIEAENARLDETHTLFENDVTPGDYVVVSVSDTGVGMDAETLHKAFEPFFTTKEIGQGSGLGLSMVYGFAKQSGGRVKIYSEPGEGTTVRVYLPRTTESASVETPKATRTELLRGTERILVVEDDAMVREHVARQLTALGYDVTLAVNGIKALNAIERGKVFDLLFTDVVMPGGMNGRQLAEAAVKTMPGLRVLFTSGYTENAIVHHGRLDRGVHLLSKPYRRSELAAKVRAVLDEPGNP